MLCRFADDVGLSLPITPAKGYHVEFAGAVEDAQRPIYFADAHCVATPLEGRLRIAGTLEIGTDPETVDLRRVEALRDAVAPDAGLILCHHTKKVAKKAATKPVAKKASSKKVMTKPVAPDDLVATVRRLMDRRRLQERTGIIGEAAPIQEVLVKIEQMAEGWTDRYYQQGASQISFFGAANGPTGERARNYFYSKSAHPAGNNGWSNGAGENAWHYDNPEFDALIDAGPTNFDTAAQDATYQQACQIMADDLPWLRGAAG